MPTPISRTVVNETDSTVMIISDDRPGFSKVEVYVFDFARQAREFVQNLMESDKPIHNITLLTVDGVEVHQPVGAF